MPIHRIALSRDPARRAQFGDANAFARLERGGGRRWWRLVTLKRLPSGLRFDAVQTCLMRGWHPGDVVYRLWPAFGRFEPVRLSGRKRGWAEYAAEREHAGSFSPARGAKRAAGSHPRRPRGRLARDRAFARLANGIAATVGASPGPGPGPGPSPGPGRRVVAKNGEAA